MSGGHLLMHTLKVWQRTMRKECLVALHPTLMLPLSLSNALRESTELPAYG
jgi:hypothetical protein